MIHAAFRRYLSDKRLGNRAGGRYRKESWEQYLERHKEIRCKTMVNLYPTKCNLCGGQVFYVSNAVVYGREYGSGWCYLCQNCGAFVGTHRPWPKRALGILADARMRKGKMICHALFDALWKGKKKASKKRGDLYCWLAEQMGIDVEDCHFGYFDLEQLRQAYKILLSVQNKQMMYDKDGYVYFANKQEQGNAG